MNLFKCFLLLWLGIGNCSTSNTPVDSVTNIKNQEIDPLPNLAFSVTRSTMYIKLPDSLSIKKANGYASLMLKIDSRGKLEDFLILKFLLKDNNKSKIDFFNEKRVSSQQKYPKDVQRYYKIFENYVNTLKVVKTGNPIDKHNFTNVIVRF